MLLVGRAVKIAMANHIHQSAFISKYAVIETSTKGTELSIGESCVIDDFVKIKHVGGDGNIDIGQNVYINSGTVIYSGNGVTIGNDVLMGPNCSLVPVNHEYVKRDTLVRKQGFKDSKGGIIIEDDVWLGAGVVVVDGVRIGKGAIIGANSLLITNVPAYSIYAGSPAVKIGAR